MCRVENSPSGRSGPVTPPALSRADCRLLVYVSRGAGRGRYGLQGARDGLRSGPARAHPVRVHDHVPHHLPGFTIGLSAYIATLGVLWLRRREERYHRLMRFWTKIFAVSFAMGVVSGIVLSYQFGTNWSRFSVVGRQRRRPADRLRGADRVLPRGDLPRHPAVRLQPGAALALRAVGGRRRCRHGDVGVLDPRRQQLDADADRPRDAGRHRVSGRLARRSSSTRASRIASPTWSTPPTSPPASWCWRSARATCSPAACRRSAHHAADGDRPHRHPGAAPAADRRPARAEHARAPADQGRRHGGRTGTAPSRATSTSSPGRTRRRNATSSRSRSRAAPRWSSPTARRAVPGPEGRAAERAPAGRRRCSSAFRIMLAIGFFMIASALFGAWLWWRGRLFETRWYLRIWRTPGGSASSR